MQEIIYLAQHEGQTYDFRPTVPQLLSIYDSKRPEAQRIMALLALHAIGDPGAMRRLDALSAMESSDRVRVLTLVVLDEYGGRLGD